VHQVNYKDVPQNQRVISEYELQEFARNAGTEPTPRTRTHIRCASLVASVRPDHTVGYPAGKFVRCLECSMRNCYGMKGIRCFFNLPFLKLKVPALARPLLACPDNFPYLFTNYLLYKSCEQRIYTIYLHFLFNL
jgi:hypothetical protein